MKRAKQETVVLKKGKAEIRLDFSELRKVVLALRALDHEVRQQIVALLDEGERLSVTDIYVRLRLEQSVISQHLAILRTAEVVHTQRQGKFIQYFLNPLCTRRLAVLIDQLGAPPPPLTEE